MKLCEEILKISKSLLTRHHEILPKKLNHYGARSKANYWFSSFLTNRKQYVSINGFFCQTKTVRFGFSQDTTFGPLLKRLSRAGPRTVPRRTFPARTFLRQVFPGKSVPRRHYPDGQLPDEEFPEGQFPKRTTSPMENSTKHIFFLFI